MSGQVAPFSKPQTSKGSIPTKHLDMMTLLFMIRHEWKLQLLGTTTIPTGYQGCLQDLSRQLCIPDNVPFRELHTTGWAFGYCISVVVRCRGRRRSVVHARHDTMQARKAESTRTFSTTGRIFHKFITNGTFEMAHSFFLLFDIMLLLIGQWLHKLLLRW
jgi:hypothetical protein